MTDPNAAIAAMNDRLATTEEAGPADVLADAVALLREAATLYDAREQPESAGLLRRLARELTPVPAAVPPAADRAALSARLWAVAEHHIVAEWICCEPLAPRHTLCAKGYAALGMAKTLLVDGDPQKAWNPSAPLLDAVLSVLPDTARLHDEILTLKAELASMRDLLRTENQRANSAIDRETTTEDAEEEHRLALSTALGLGTGAPWDAIRARATELAADRGAMLRELADKAEEWDGHITKQELRRMADETPQPETQTDEAHPAEHTWAAELRDPLADEWAPGTRYVVRDRAVDALAHAQRLAPTWTDGTPTQRRLVRATTTYTVEQPAAVAPPVHVGGNVNAEDCPACSGTNPPYPFICPGPDAVVAQPAKEA